MRPPLSTAVRAVDDGAAGGQRQDGAAAYFNAAVLQSQAHRHDLAAGEVLRNPRFAVGDDLAGEVFGAAERIAGNELL